MSSCLLFIIITPFSWTVPLPLIPKDALQLHSRTASARLSSSYGLLRSMTGVGKDRMSKLNGTDVRVLRVQRPELILEALPVGSSRWIEVPFLYKPSNLHQPLPTVAPFQPRLDWQMWFAVVSYIIRA